MNTYEYPQTKQWFERACKVLPGGIPGHFGAGPYVPVGDYPFFGARAKGAKFWDVDGNEFIDYMCAYGPMVQGYANPIVDEAYAKQAAQADTNSLASPVMVELAEFLVDLIPMADWAFFAKNGADITNYAVAIARSATGRRKIVAIQGGYHGTTPWMQAPGHHGVMEPDLEDIVRIPWNDFEALEKVVAAHEGEIAGFIASPYHHPVFGDNALPAEGYWKKVEQLLRAKGIVFIIDDVRAGFRLNMGGSCEHYGFKPDLVCFCKAIGNGYPISALVGCDALKIETAKVFHTGSYWYSAGPMAAALANLKELKRIDGPKIMREKADKLYAGMVDIAKNHGYTLKVSGEPSMAYLRLTDDPSLKLQQNWCGQCTRRGAFFTSHHNWFISTAHTDEDIQRTWDICDDAFKAVKENPII